MADTNGDFKNLSLLPCCRETLSTIHDRLNTGKWLDFMSLTGPFFAAFSDSPPFVLYSIVTGDWNGLQTSLKSIDNFIRNRIEQDIEMEVTVRHPGGELHRFWMNMLKAFTS